MKSDADENNESKMLLTLCIGSSSYILNNLYPEFFVEKELGNKYLTTFSI
jgi:hypothetical protein